MGKIFKEKSDIQYKRSFQKNKVSLGMGGFAEVKLVYHKDDPETLYAMKKVKKRHQQKIENIHKEISLHSKLTHPNIIKFIDQLETHNSYLFFLEYAENGDLYNYIKNNKLSLNEIIDYFQQICNAVDYLHSQNIMHRDLKLENILLTKDKKIKLCDFGWSVVFDNDQNRETLCGTYEYMAYEIFLGQPQTVKTDIWALGIILYELFHRRPPFRAKNLPGIIQMIQNPKTNLIMDPNIPSQAKILIKNILQLNPLKRPSIKKILKYDFFNIKINTCQQELSTNNKNFNKKNNAQKLNIPLQNKKDFTSSQDTLFDKHSTVGTLNEKKISIKKLLNKKSDQEINQQRNSPTQKLFQQLYQSLKKDNISKKNSEARKTNNSKKSNNSKKKLKKKKTCKFEEQIENRNKSKTYTQKLFQTNLFDQNYQKNYSQSKRFTHKERSQVTIRDRIKPTKHSVKVQKYSLVNRREPFKNTSCEKNKNILRFNIPDLGIKKLLATPQQNNRRQESQEVKRKISFTEGKKFVNSIYMQIQKQKSNIERKVQKLRAGNINKNNIKDQNSNKKKIHINLSQQNSNQSIGSLNEDFQKISKNSQQKIIEKGITYKRYQSFQQGIQLSYREKITARKVKTNLNNGFLNIYSRNKKSNNNQIIFEQYLMRKIDEQESSLMGDVKLTWGINSSQNQQRLIENMDQGNTKDLSQLSLTEMLSQAKRNLVDGNQKNQIQQETQSSKKSNDNDETLVQKQDIILSEDELIILNKLKENDLNYILTKQDLSNIEIKQSLIAKVIQNLEIKINQTPQNDVLLQQIISC